MRKLILLLVLACLLSTSVYAEDLLSQQAEAYGANELEREIPNEVKNLLNETKDDTGTRFIAVLRNLFAAAIKNGESAMEITVKNMLRILCIATLCRIMSCVDLPHMEIAVSVTGTIGVTLCCVSDLRNLIGLGLSSMNELVSFSGILMPVMAAAAAGSGSVNSAIAIQSIAVFFFHLLIRLCNSVLLPLVYAGLGMSVVDSVLQSNKLKGFRDLINWMIKTGLKYMTYAFSGIVSLSGLVAGTADAAAVKAAKSAISMAVPVVGSMVSGAADTILSNAAWLKSSIGIYGVLALLGIFLFPFIKMGISYLSFRLTTAVCAVVESKLSSILEAVSQSMGYLMAMTATGLLMGLLSCFCLMRTGQP